MYIHIYLYFYIYIYDILDLLNHEADFSSPIILRHKYLQMFATNSSYWLLSVDRISCVSDLWQWPEWP